MGVVTDTEDTGGMTGVVASAGASSFSSSSDSVSEIGSGEVCTAGASTSFSSSSSACGVGSDKVCSATTSTFSSSSGSICETGSDEDCTTTASIFSCSTPFVSSTAVSPSVSGDGVGMRSVIGWISPKTSRLVTSRISRSLLCSPCATSMGTNMLKGLLSASAKTDRGVKV